MRQFGNVIWWVPFLGFIDAAYCYLLGSLMILTVIGAPIGFGLWQLGHFYLAPFTSALVPTREVRRQHGARTLWNALAFLIWLPFGLLLAALTILQIALLFLTIVGIPAGIVLAKSLGAIFNPTGKLCRSIAMRDEIARRRATREIDRNFAPHSPRRPRSPDGHPRPDAGHHSAPGHQHYPASPAPHAMPATGYHMARTAPVPPDAYPFSTGHAASRSRPSSMSAVAREYDSRR